MRFRSSNNPQKQFLWFMLEKDLRSTKQTETFTDFGCGNLKNRRFVNCSEYYGVDIDQDLIEQGKKKYQNVNVTNSTILEYSGKKTDWVICVQVFVNSEFDESFTINTVHKMVEQVKNGGTLIFNTSAKTKKFENDILKIIMPAFKNVKVSRYGKLAPFLKNRLLAFVFGFLAFHFKSLRNEANHQKTYYLCKSKI